MNLAIFHYHLNRGGVTRVIQNHLLALAELSPAAWPDSVTILYGGRDDGWRFDEQTLPFPVTRRAIKALDYDQLQIESSHDLADSTSDSIASELEGRLTSEILQALQAANCERETTLLHFHNHGLGKNASLLNTLATLIEDGWRVLLQIHDFAEELRPDNYAHLLRHFSSLEELQFRLYPYSPRVHYATLTERDADCLRNAGLPDEQIHLLPNPVLVPGLAKDRAVARERLCDLYHVDPSRPFVLYPVRGIRRKNIGELLLWSVMVPDATFAVTLAPKNPTERRSFDAWQQVAKELKLGVLFDIGRQDGMTLEDNYAAADAVITTSVAEGFGLVFLEANLAGVELFGRDLPAVTNDFRAQGLQFPGLAEQLLVPSASIDVSRLKSVYARLARELGERYQTSTDTSGPLVDGKIDTMLDGSHIDFGRMDRVAQEQALLALVQDKAMGEEVDQHNNIIQKLRDALQCSEPSPIIKENCQRAAESYSLSGIGQRYQQICQEVLNSQGGLARSSALPGREVLKYFLHVENIFALRLDD